MTQLWDDLPQRRLINCDSCGDPFDIKTEWYDFIPIQNDEESVGYWICDSCCHGLTDNELAEQIGIDVRHIEEARRG